ncbi:MAG: xanthine dehydrogenase family protein subunit M [SAR324 cluster bacterium]|nr:xanthine dehydrogenase family protein subunit M [SAR324 cluster bacterium]
MKYEAPKSIDEALELLESEPDSCVFAGATDIIPQMRSGRPEPKLMIDLKCIPEMVQIACENKVWTIGAAVPAVLIAGDSALKSDFPGLAESAGLIGSDQIQNRASLGGNVCNASPAADTVPALIVNNAHAVIASKGGMRTLPVALIATGPGSTSLNAGEFIVAFRIEQPLPHSADAYLRFIPRTEMDIAVVGAAARITMDKAGNCTDAVIALGAVAPTAVRVTAAEDALRGNPIDEDTLTKIMAAARAACNPIDDKRGSKEYRTQVAGVLAKRVVIEAADRARK